jgi:hypothetical protein
MLDNVAIAFYDLKNIGHLSIEETVFFLSKFETGD